jgi:hypothetical protein
MKNEALPIKAPAFHPETEHLRHSVARVLTKLAHRCGSLCHRMGMLLRRSSAQDGEPSCSSVQQESDKIELANLMKMLFASFHQQTTCECKSCECELMVTALREEFLFSESSPKDRHLQAIYEPFTATEAQLIDTNDEEYIRSAYPALASRIQDEIEAGYGDDRRLRGLSCTAATRH